MSIGQTLADARTKAGLTVDQVSEVTRIRQPLVEAIEQDDFAGCGGDFYARGHIRTYAKAVGVDAEPLLAEYDQAHGKGPVPSPTVIFEPERVKPDRKLAPNWTAAMAAAIVAVLAFAAFQLVGGSDDDGKTQAGKTSAPPASASATQAAPVPPSSPPVQEVVAQVPVQVKVKVTAVDGKSWVRATDSTGKKVYFEGTLDKGASQEFTDPTELKLVVGNAEAARLVVNGKDIGPASTKNSVVRLAFKPGDPQQG
ncbi:helix-turn-helix domain-containing protein [Yinghuangia soli]|uniref:Helix-turn-helix domain-containing protein n=1 Tax=Yinghuangia soli TaxID=2908204 RepID=A0AA41U4E1_9ACTN|nr:helix-turn-helix domain-containing protein [Yinghuangia soli]MCF2532801.1 helix-turn-helix domain-containing protein [Yinghuangia soli]